MQQRHWTDEELVARLYGVGPEDGHLEACTACAHRWDELFQRRQKLIEAEPEVPQELLAEQRRSVMARLDRPRHSVSRGWIPLCATALLLITVFTLWRPAGTQEPVAEISDAQMFEKIFTKVSTPEPPAVEPLRSLFEVSK